MRSADLHLHGSVTVAPAVPPMTNGICSSGSTGSPKVILMAKPGVFDDMTGMPFATTWAPVARPQVVLVMAPMYHTNGFATLFSLLAGDHLIKHISSNPLISRPLDGSSQRSQALVTYIESLRKTREMPAEIVLPGHGDPVIDHVALIDERLAKHDRRKEKIHKLIAEQPRSGYELAQAIWGNVAVTQAFLTLSEVIGHADLLVNEGHLREVDDGTVVRYETTG